MISRSIVAFATAARRLVACFASTRASTLAITLAVTFAIILETAPRAEAQPTIWERVASTVTPTAEDRDYAHKYYAEMWHGANELEAEARHAEPTLARMGRGSAMRALQAARAVLDRFGAAVSPDVRLHFDLGQVLTRLEEWERAIGVLQSALAMDPSSSRAEDAWFSLAICQAHLGSRDLEEKSYLEALAISDDPDFRAIAYANLAESRMGLGKLDLAVEAAEASLELYADSALTRWTLAVIRDRQGDAYGALAEAKRAIALDPYYLQLESPDVFFEPDYDVHWYRGLGELAHADAIGNATSDKASGDDRKMRLLSAMFEFDLYAGETPETDRFRPRVLEHIAQIEKELALTPKPSPGKKSAPKTTPSLKTKP